VWKRVDELVESQVLPDSDCTDESIDSFWDLPIQTKKNIFKVF
jgi:hypothetical protein